MNPFTMGDDPFDPGPAKAILTIELVPSSSWGDNLRSRLSKSDWDKLRKAAYKAAGYRCEICNDVGSNQGVDWPVECHEIWSYDDTTHVQSLVSLISLCPMCHSVIHFGLTTLRGRSKESLVHMARVNGWTIQRCETHVKDAFAKHAARSKHAWTVDISILDMWGVRVK